MSTIIGFILGLIIGAIAWDYFRKKLIIFVNKNFGMLSGKKPESKTIIETEIIPPKKE